MHGRTLLPRGGPPQTDLAVDGVSPVRLARIGLVHGEDDFGAVEVDEILEVRGSGPGVEDGHRHSSLHAGEVTNHRADRVSREQEGETADGLGQPPGQGRRRRTQFRVGPPAPLLRVEERRACGVDTRRIEKHGSPQDGSLLGSAA